MSAARLQMVDMGECIPVLLSHVVSNFRGLAPVRADRGQGGEGVGQGAGGA